MKAKTEEQLKLPKYYASVIVMNHLGQVLLGIRKEDGIATPPGGHAQDHETPEAAAVRELYEETALIAREHDLITLPTIDTTNGKVCHCFLFISTQNDPTPKLDPDKEVSTWSWYTDHQLPKELEKDPRRHESVRNAFMKFHGIIKGGPGSGVTGHTTQKQQLQVGGGGDTKLVDLATKLVETNPFKELLHKLQNGAIFEGHELRSGKPLYLDVNQSMAHGYSPEDYKEAGNFHYEKAEGMSKQIQKIKALGKQPPPDMQKIVKFHEGQFKQNFKMAEKTHKRTSDTEAAMKEKKSEANKKANISKSVVMLGQQDGAEVDTGKFSTEHSTNLSSWEYKIHREMEGYGYGDAPRSMLIDKGTLHLTKVDDGMYSGYVTLMHDVPGEDQVMLDNAKVRIERMSVPSLAQFLLAKEYILPNPVSGASSGNNSIPMSGEMALAQPEKVEALTESLMVEPLSESTISTELNHPAIPHGPLDRKIRILELIDKLTS